MKELFDKYNFNKRAEEDKVNIDIIESRVNFMLPDDYKFYAINYIENETFIGDEFVTLWDANKLLEVNEDYEILKNLKDTIAIGDNGGSEFIAIELIDHKEYRIILSPFIDLDTECHIEIGNSFTDFFIRLENGIEWFE